MLVHPINPNIYRVLYILGGAEFLPPTAVHDINILSNRVLHSWATEDRNPLQTEVENDCRDGPPISRAMHDMSKRKNKQKLNHETKRHPGNS